MKRALALSALALFAATALACAQSAHHARTSSAASNAALKARIHAFLNRSLGWQKLDTLQVESISAPDASGIRTAKVMLAKGDQHKEATYYITADGKEIIEGALNHLSADPWAENRAEIDLRGAPAMGDAHAPVTIVEYSDLECPYCKEEAASLEQLMNVDPGKARLVFKYFPLTDIHPWSMQAAEAAVCVTAQGAPKFWNFEKAVFAAQEQVTADTAAKRLRDFASEAGADTTEYDACLLKPSTHAAVEASIANGKKVGVVSTPSLFINGRLIPGAIAEQQLQMLVDHEATYKVADNYGGDIHGKQCGTCKPLAPLPKKIKH